ncbi:MAG: sigma-70 family RNA polymerase sigma factor [Clostridia bacterium]|jgi:RNA polymerase sporulation-specific sigma factor|nr:sigma-70 family RNA polymerase sigma factor [Clostridia bacterium]
MNVRKSKKDVRALILDVRGGDQNAFDTLLDQYRPLIDASVARFSSDESFSLYCEDLKQEASVVFYNSILAYDLDQNEVEFGLFAKICIYNALVSFLRALKRRSAEPVAEIPQNLITVQDFEDPSARMLEQERLKSLYAVIRKNLSELEYKVWQLYISGRSAAEIAALLSTDEKSVNNAIYRIRKKLRAVLR